MLLNTVYLDKTANQRLRVIFDGVDFIWIVDIDDNAWPIYKKKSELQELIDTDIFHLIAEPFKQPIPPAGSIQEIKRDQAYSILKPLLTEYSALFDKKLRTALIKEAVIASGKGRVFIVRQLKRYWQRGMNPNALLPDYYLSGGKGKPRRKVENKLGRKRSNAAGVGAIVTEEVADIFRLVIEGFYIQNDKMPITEANIKAISIFKTQYPNADKTSIPTLRQFSYFYKKNYRKNEIIKQRTPSKIYDKDIRALTSTATYMNFGPGGRYEIDATIGDIYLVSDVDPERIIGRPVIYLVKDVFSRMVVGLYVGLENPSWVAAMMAMSNAFLDKVEFCQSYGVEIDSSLWPSIGIPASIFADRGELLHRQADVLVNVFDIQLSNSRSYRGDDKGVGERHFKSLQAKFRPYVAGVVEPVNGKKRLGRRYELDAELTLHSFTKMMIYMVINYNHQHVVKSYDFAADMPEVLPAVPIQLWNWGIQYRTGRLKPCQDDWVRISLLPCEQGTVSEVGIGFKGLKYTCSEALRKGWFDRFTQKRPDKVDISFDPRRVDIVYLRPDNSYEHYWICELSDRSRRYAGLSFVDAAGVLKLAKSTYAQARQHQDFYAPDLQSKIEEIVAHEQAKKPKKPTKSKSERLSGIRDNRREARELERQVMAINVKPKVTSEHSADIHDLNQSCQSRRAEYPSLDDYLDDSDE